MQIIAGKHKGRKLEGPKDATIRPMTNFAKQAIFSRLEFWQGENILKDAVVADCFCGTGAMGIEALSRGAGHVTFIDKNAESLSITKKNIAAIKEEPTVDYVIADVTEVPKSKQQYDIVFITPPYGHALAEPSLQALNTKGWIKNTSLVMVEIEGKENFACPADFEVLDERRYAAAKIIFVKRKT